MSNKYINTRYEKHWYLLVDAALRESSKKNGVITLTTKYIKWDILFTTHNIALMNKVRFHI